MSRLEILLVTALCTGCSAGPSPTPVECTGTPPATAVTPSQADVSALSGKYELVTVLTSHGGAPLIERGRLELAGGEGSTAHRGRLQGSYAPADGRYPSEQVELERGVLYVGCRACPDASPDQYVIEAVAPPGFWGRWENFQTGIWSRFKGEKRALPNPAGYFCALRRD